MFDRLRDLLEQGKKVVVNDYNTVKNDLSSRVNATINKAKELPSDFNVGMNVIKQSQAPDRLKQIIGNTYEKANNTMANIDMNNSYFKPTPNIRTRDFVRELPNAAYQTGKDIVQSVPAGIKALTMKTGERFTPNTNFEKAVYGEKPVVPATESYFAKKTGIPLLGVGMTALGVGINFIPGGKGDAKALETTSKIIASTEDAGTIAKALRSARVAEKDVPALVTTLKTTNRPEEVLNTLKNYHTPIESNINGPKNSEISTPKTESVPNLEQKSPNQQLVSENIPQTNPPSQIPTLQDQKTSSFGKTVSQKATKNQLSETETELATSKQYLDKLIKDEAKMLRDYEESAGVGIMKMEKANGEGGGMDYARYSEHGKEYRDYFKKYGHKPPLSFWRDIAKQNIESGKSQLSDEYNTVREYVSSLEEIAKAERIDAQKPQEIAGLLTTPAKNPLLLPQGRPINSVEAKRIFKKTGESVDFVNQLKPSEKPIITYNGLDYAEKTLPNGNKVPIFTKSGDLVDKDLQLAIEDALLRNKDKPLLSLHNQSPVRNIEDIFGDKAGIVKEYLPEKAASNETQRVKWLDKEVGQLRNEVDNLGIKFNSKEDQLAHRFAEKRMTLDELKQELPDTWQNAKKYADLAREKYDSYLEQINKSLTKAGYSPIPKKDDYITHLNELSVADNIFGGLFNIPKDKLPAIMNQIHLNTKPGRQWFSFGQRRTNGPFVESITNALDAYLPAASKQIFHTDTAQSARNFEKTLKATLENNPQSKALSNFAKWLTDYINHLTGKGSIIDRSMEGMVGRQMPAAINWLRRRSSANMVGANVSSELTNFIPFTQSLATTSKIAAGKGIMDSWASGFSKTPNIIDGVESSFLTRRFAGKDKITQTIGNKAVGAAQWLFEAIDKFVANSVVAGKYYEGITKGLSKTEAMKIADDYGARLITDRSFGQMPTLYNSKTMGLLTQFQAEVNNQLSFIFKDIPKMSQGNTVEMVSMLGQVAVYSYLFNNLFEKATGRKPALDPIGFALQTIQTSTNQNLNTKQKAKLITEDAANNLPYASTLTGGGRIPLSSSLPSLSAIMNGDSNWKKELKKLLFNILPPTGGGQLKKTIEGISAYSKGASQNDNGKVRFPIDKNVANAVRTAVFGQYSTPEAKTYFNNARTPLSDTQSEIFKLLGGKSTEYYNKVVNERQNNADADKLISQIKTGKVKNSTTTTDNPDLIPLSNGKIYSKTLDQQFDTEKKAKKALTEDQFDKSGQPYAAIDETFYYRDKNNEVQSKPISEIKDKKYELDYTLKLEQAKRNDDLNSWFKIQDEYISKLETEYKGLDKNNPLDQLRAIEIENKLGDIGTTYTKYKSQGGFTKGKTKKFYNPLSDNSNDVTLSTYKNLQKILAGTKSVPRISTSQGIGRKVQLIKQRMKG